MCNNNNVCKCKTKISETSLCPTRGANSVCGGRGGLGHLTGSHEGCVPPHMPGQRGRVGGAVHGGYNGGVGDGGCGGESPRG